jgi:hypothetical protein
MKRFLLYVVLFKISGTISHHVANQPNSFYLFEVLVLLGTVVGTVFDEKEEKRLQRRLSKGNQRRGTGRHW